MRIGIDVGTVRVGVSSSDPSGLLATPLETVARAKNGRDVGRIQEIVTERQAIELVVGLPLSLRGERTTSTRDAEEFASALARSGVTPVRLVDERLSTVSAQAGMHASGRTTKSSRSVIDQAAATVILQHALDLERASGRLPGLPVDPTIGTTP